ncbi:MAG TPA: MupA/Atu3671 family FMN-dependent luciferase-like monooxygenase [Pyrinomonadaceae bacterium]|nr:MupA/Atu3671 family FMN-dependent luciferase-like monooxygenase [Pyrinomonadaceae bacterium]
MSDVSSLLAGLSPEQRKRLAQRLANRNANTPPSNQEPALEPDVISDQRLKKGMDFSLLFFSGDGATQSMQKYQLLLESAKFADQHDFAAVWTPERHFQNFGGLYPNPSVLGAALSVVTERIQIRAGSIVAPLHNVIRIAEEWAVVDNLSGGRIALSFASGYHPGDFTLAPDNYQNRRDITFQNIDLFRRLWKGEPVSFRGVGDAEMPITILPKPVQPEVPIWLTSSASTGTWIKAAESGFNILTALTGVGAEPLVALSKKISLYRETLAQHGHDPQAGKVALMLHTFIDDDMDAVREKVRQPLSGYLRTFMSQDEKLTTKEFRAGVADIRDDDKDALVAFAFNQFLNTSSLLGTPEKCAGMVDRLLAIGVDEVACLVDFGLDVETVLKGLEYLNELRVHYRPTPDVERVVEAQERS